MRSRWADVQPRADEKNAFLENHTWDDYAAWHLALTEGPADDTKARYAFVFGDFRRLHRMGLIACHYRTAGSRKTRRGRRSGTRSKRRGSGPGPPGPRPHQKDGICAVVNAGSGDVLQGSVDRDSRLGGGLLERGEVERVLVRVGLGE